MSLLFDIETVPVDVDTDVAHAVVAAAHRRSDRYGDTDDEKAERVARAIDELGLSPWSARVAVVSMWDTQTGKGACFVDADGAVDPPVLAEHLPPGFAAVNMNSERSLVADVWKSIAARSQIVSWNGLDFDAPFLLARAVALGVAFPMTLLDAKPWDRAHLDLCALFAGGDRRNRAGLDVAAIACGLPSPKHALNGRDVGAAWKTGRKADVARYCCLDVVALLGVFRAFCVSAGWTIPAMPPVDAEYVPSELELAMRETTHG